MKLLLVAISLMVTITTHGQPQSFITTDIEHFWKAYDKITSTADSVQQYNFLRTLYLEKATPGLKSLMEVRNYTEKDFVDAIKQYPVFWKSIKPNTQQIKKILPSLEKDINKLKLVYPDLKPAPIYFSMGAFRTNGTVHDRKILIGCELALADNTTKTDELPDWRRPFYKSYNPKENINLLCIHEYIHTQQNELIQNLLSMCLYEGVAEFISCLATGRKSTVPAVAFGKVNQQAVVAKFVEDLFIMNSSNWLWGENRNELQVRDLGYYVGYEISERYYNLSEDKNKAVKELIELDYTDEKEVERIVNSTHLLPKTLEELFQDYEKSRPSVTSLAPFENGSELVKPGLTKITVIFSEPLNGYNTGIDFGPLGENHCPRITLNRLWSDDGRSWTFEADLKPNQQYQILISNNFRKQNGVRLKPYLIEFKTTN